MKEQYGFLVYADANQVQKTVEDPSFQEELSALAVKNPTGLLEKLNGICQQGSANRSCLFMDFRYVDYAAVGKGLSYRMPVYGVKGQAPGLTRAVNYSQLYVCREEDMNGVRFIDRVFGADYLTGRETVESTESFLRKTLRRVRPVSYTIQDPAGTARIAERLWHVQEQNPSTRLIILTKDAEKNSAEILRQLYLLLPHRLRLQLGFESNVTKRDLEVIQENSGLPIYVLTAEKNTFDRTDRPDPRVRRGQGRSDPAFPVELFDPDEDTEPYDPKRLEELTALAEKMNEAQAACFSYAERKVLEQKETGVSSFRYYQEFFDAYRQDSLYWWRDGHIQDIRLLPATLEDQDELMQVPSLKEEAVDAFFTRILPSGENLARLAGAVENPDTSSGDSREILKVLGKQLPLKPYLDAYRQKIESLEKDKRQAVASRGEADQLEKESALNKQGKELAQKAYAQQREQKEKYEAKIRQYEETISRKDREYSELQDRFTKADSEKKASQKQLERSLADVKNLRKSAEELKARTNWDKLHTKEDLKKKLDDAVHENRTLSGRVERLKQDRVDLEHENRRKGVGRTVFLITTLLAAAVAAGGIMVGIRRLNTQKEETGRVQNTADELQKQAAELSSENSSLRDEQTSLQSELSAAHSSESEYEARNQQLQSELDAARSRIQAQAETSSETESESAAAGQTGETGAVMQPGQGTDQAEQNDQSGETVQETGQTGQNGQSGEAVQGAGQTDQSVQNSQDTGQSGQAGQVSQ